MERQASEDDSVRGDFFERVLPIIKGEAETPESIQTFAGDRVYVMILEWLEYRALPFTKSVMKAETTPPSESGAVEILAQSQGPIVHLHEAMLNSVEAMLERCGMMQRYRAHLLLNRFTQLMRLSQPTLEKVVARSSSMEAVCMMVASWLERSKLSHSLEILKREVKHEYDLDVSSSEVDLEVVLQRFLDRTGQWPEYMEEIV